MIYGWIHTVDAIEIIIKPGQWILSFSIYLVKIKPKYKLVHLYSQNTNVSLNASVVR